MSSTEGTVTSAKGYQLYTRVYKPSTPVKGIVIFHHGVASHCCPDPGAGFLSYPAQFTSWCQAASVAIVTYDCRGHGRSEPTEERERLFVFSMEDLVDDVYQVRKELADPLQPAGGRVPVFMMGHSMGGLVTILTVLRDQSAWQGAILHAPACDAERGLVLRIMAAVQSVLVPVIPYWRLVPVPPLKNVSWDAQVVKAMEADPYVNKKNLPVRTGRAFLDGFNAVATKSSTIGLPLLIMHSPIEKICVPAATKKFSEQVKSKDLTVHWIEGGAHDMMQGHEGPTIQGHVIDWLKAHT